MIEGGLVVYGLLERKRMSGRRTVNKKIKVIIRKSEWQNESE